MSQAIPSCVRDAIAELQAFKEQPWAVTMTTERDAKQYIERFNPTLDGVERWKLLSVNGKAPSKDQLSRHRKRCEGQKDNVMPDLMDCIQADSFRLAREDQHYQYFEFRPKFDKPLYAQVAKHVLATLWFDKSGEFIERLQIANESQFTAMPSVKVNQFFGLARFGYEKRMGSSLLLLETQMVIKGKKFFIGELDRTERVTYSNYELLDEHS